MTDPTPITYREAYKVAASKLGEKSNDNSLAANSQNSMPPAVAAATRARYVPSEAEPADEKSRAALEGILRPIFPMTAPRKKPWSWDDIFECVVHLTAQRTHSLQVEKDLKNVVKVLDDLPYNSNTNSSARARLEHYKLGVNSRLEQVQEQITAGLAENTELSQEKSIWQQRAQIHEASALSAKNKIETQKADIAQLKKALDKTEKEEKALRERYMSEKSHLNNRIRELNRVMGSLVSRIEEHEFKKADIVGIPAPDKSYTPQVAQSQQKKQDKFRVADKSEGGSLPS